MNRLEAPTANKAAVANLEEREDFLELPVISRMLIDDPKVEVKEGKGGEEFEVLLKKSCL